MQLEISGQYDAERRRARAFLDAHWSSDVDPVAFRSLAFAEGLIYRWVPQEYGGVGADRDAIADLVVRGEFERVGAVFVGTPQAEMLLPTLLEHGTSDQRQRLVADTVSGKLRWCQGYSEPDSGSDLGSLRSTATLDGDEWIVNGHKIWTSNADTAHMMYGLFRTEPQAQRTRGISYLLFDMSLPGITVRPLKQMTGGTDFSEVFLDDVRIPAASIVGERGGGWSVSMSTLLHERLGIGDPGRLQQILRQLIDRAGRQSRNGPRLLDDPVVRVELAEAAGYVETMTYAHQRVLSAIHHHDEASVQAEITMAKLAGTETFHRLAYIAIDVLGDDALALAPAELTDPGEPVNNDDVLNNWINQSLAASIAGGSANIQRNIIGEQLYGLPRDARP